MIDWWFVGSNGLWVFGLAVLLAAASYSNWLAAQRRASVASGQGRAGGKISLVVRLGLLLFSLGLWAASSGWLERRIWAAMCLAVCLEPLVSSVVARWRNRQGPSGPLPALEDRGTTDGIDYPA